MKNELIGAEKSPESLKSQFSWIRHIMYKPYAFDGTEEMVERIDWLDG
jgi:hypothetical protein